MGAALEMNDIWKSFPGGTIANRAVSLRVESGTVHAIVGENGAGKSTLMKILFGVEQPDRGEIRIDGVPRRISSPRKAIGLGIGMVFQHFSLVPSLTVAENVVLGQEPRSGVLFDRAAAEKAVGALAIRFGLPVDPTAPVGRLPIGQQQRTEILKALYRDARVLVLDEPTAVLTPQEVADLFVAVRSLVEQGRTIILIAHKLAEVMAIADTITVMRAGVVVASVPASDVDEASLARLMMGRDVRLRVEREAPPNGAVVSAIRGLHASNDAALPVLHDINLDLRAGEILGIAAVEGNGQAELLEVMSGLRRPVAGTIILNGRDVTGCSVRELRRLGVAGIPEDRLARGLAPGASIADNVVAERVDRPPLARRGVLDTRRMVRIARELTSTFGVRTADVQSPAATLSGGNMQKLVIARELSSSPSLLLAAQPTRGIDLGATEFVWQRLVAARNGGAAVVLTTADLSELLALSDRIIVLFAGRLVAHFEDPGQLSPEDLGEYMLGLRSQPEATVVG